VFASGSAATAALVGWVSLDPVEGGAGGRDGVGSGGGHVLAVNDVVRIHKIQVDYGLIGYSMAGQPDICQGQPKPVGSRSRFSILRRRESRVYDRHSGRTQG